MGFRFSTKLAEETELFKDGKNPPERNYDHLDFVSEEWDARWE